MKCIVLLLMLCAARLPGQDADSISRLAATGHLAAAEQLARNRNAPLALADILVLRGRLVVADSIYTAIVARGGADAASAAAGLAELAVRRGDREAAIRNASIASSGGGSDAGGMIAAGRGFAVLGRWQPAAFHDALQQFDRVAARDSSQLEAELRGADLLLDKYNAPDAVDGYHAVLRRDSANAWALFGVARAAAFDGHANATIAVRRSLQRNPEWVPARLLLAEQHLQAEAYDSAEANARFALAVDSTSIGAWGILGAIAWMRGDSAAFARARGEAMRAAPRAADFYSEVAEAAGRQRRYADAVAMGAHAVAADSTSARAWGVLAENQLRTGEMINGRANLDHAFTLDPYNLWHKNMLDLLDQVQRFTVTRTRRFEFVAPADESAYLTLYLGPLLETAFDTFAAKYDYVPPTPIRVELYGRHADFSVRTIGLTGLGALGVSFGTVLVLDSPRAQDVGVLNYGSTAWHELAHTFTLGRSAHRVPRWLSEGLSVLEERQTGRHWGFDVSPSFLAAYKGHALPTATNLNEGLVRPTFPDEIGDSYYEASLVCEMLEAEHKMGAIRAILSAYANGGDTPTVLRQVVGMAPAQFDQHFDQWMQVRFGRALAAIDSSNGEGPLTGRYFSLLRDGTVEMKANHLDSARILLHAAEAILPTDGTSDGPAAMLAALEQGAGQTADAIRAFEIVTTHNEVDADANQAEADLLLQRGDSVAALAALARKQWIAPYDIALHLQIAGLSEQGHDFEGAVRARRSIVALAPVDSLEARYQLARVLLLAGKRDEAHRLVLSVLEQAPAFEKAQSLLLELQSGHS